MLKRRLTTVERLKGQGLWTGRIHRIAIPHICHDFLSLHGNKPLTSSPGMSSTTASATACRMSFATTAPVPTTVARNFTNSARAFRDLIRKTRALSAFE